MTRQSSIIPVILGIAALIISACSAGGGGEESETSGNNTSAIAGLWVASGSLGVENGWFNIDRSGILTSYAQSTKHGAECFVAESGTESFTSLEGNNYFYSSPVAQYFAELFVTAEGHLFQRKENESTGMVVGIKPAITMSQLEELIDWTGYCRKLVDTDNAPAIPRNFRAIAGSQQITLTWDAVNNAEKLIIFWDTKPIPTDFDEAMTSVNRMGIFNDRNTIVVTAYPDRSYHFRIASFSNRGETKGLSAEVSVSVLP